MLHVYTVSICLRVMGGNKPLATGSIWGSVPPNFLCTLNFGVHRNICFKHIRTTIILPPPNVFPSQTLKPSCKKSIHLISMKRPSHFLRLKDGNEQK